MRKSVGFRISALAAASALCLAIVPVADAGGGPGRNGGHGGHGGHGHGGHRSSCAPRSFHGAHRSFGHHGSSFRAYHHRSSCKPSYRSYRYCPPSSIGYGYGYGYFGGSYRPYYSAYSYPRRTYISSTSYLSAPAPSEVVVERAAAPPQPALDLSEAFTMLSDGRTTAARSLFSQHAIASPSEGLPKAGYALASALDDDDHSAVWAMRRAFAQDAPALHYFAADATLRTRMESLIERYTLQAGQEGRVADSWFMCAALHFLLHKYSESQVVLDKAVQAGDGSESAAALAKTLDEELRRDSAAPAEPVAEPADEQGPPAPDRVRIIASASDGASAGYEVVRSGRWIEIRRRTP